MNADELKSVLAKRRIEKKLSCRALADSAGIHHRTVQHFFSDERKNVHVDILVDIIHALGYDIQLKEICNDIRLH